jgi:tellurite resistance protein TerC
MGTPLLWVGFNVFVLLAIALDVGVFHRKSRKIEIREAALWSLVWISLSLAFGYCLWHWYGTQPGLEYFTAYVIEKALSVDNLFVFLLIFGAFSVAPQYQQRVLAWGILGALLMRGAMIAAGVALIREFEWILYLFGAFLIYAAARMLLAKDTGQRPEKNFLVRFASRHLRMTREFHAERFFVQHGGRWSATPLLLVLLVIEITDVTFALDSIPAIFGITRNPFIVYTSNVFAILGLRALYFLLAGVLDRLTNLRFGLAIMLAFVGVKMLAEPWIHIAVELSLGIILAVLAATIASSLAAKPRKPEREPPPLGDNPKPG